MASTPATGHINPLRYGRYFPLEATRVVSGAPAGSVANLCPVPCRTYDPGGANTAAIESYNAAHDTEVEIRQVKYLNNVVEQDHRAIKRQVRPMMGFKSFWSAAATLAGIELMHLDAAPG